MFDYNKISTTDECDKLIALVQDFRSTYDSNRFVSSKQNSKNGKVLESLPSLVQDLDGKITQAAAHLATLAPGEAYDLADIELMELKLRRHRLNERLKRNDIDDLYGSWFEMTIGLNSITFSDQEVVNLEARKAAIQQGS